MRHRSILARGRSAAIFITVLLAAGGVTAAAQAAAPVALTDVGIAPQLPAGAAVLGTLSPATRLSVAVTLQPRDLSGLQAFATAVSTPGSPVFRQYLTVAQFRAAYAPDDGAIAAVRSALSGAGLQVSPVAANGLLIDVSGTAAQMARTFSTSFQRVRTADGRVAYADTSAPTLPATVAGTVQSVVGLDSLALPQPVGALRRDAGARSSGHGDATAATGGPQACQAAQKAGGYTANQFASAYDFTGLYAQGDLGAGASIGLFEQEPFAPSDLAAYQSCYGTSATVTNVPVDGGAGTGEGSGESILDVETVVGLAPQAHVYTYSGPTGNAGFVDIYEAMVDADQAKVLSTSWYVGPCDPYTPAAITRAEATVFAEAAAQGQSFMNASGDDGSDGCHGSKHDPGPELQDPSGQSLVTDVGGTSLTQLGPPPTERVWNNDTGASGGGISAYDTMPAYQRDASASLGVVNRYSSGAPCGAPAGEYCREAPDVAADADPYTGYTVYQRHWTAYGGTSAAAPLWAALIALADASPACHGTSIGFANPLLYSLAGAAYATDFHDVTVGNDDAYGTESGLYPATPGYDLSTGLGTPNGANLAAGLCAGARSAVTVIDPGTQQGFAGTQMSVPVPASDATGATLTYRAVGLPAGLAINPVNGVISGAPTAVGTSLVTVTATDPDGAAAAVTFRLTVGASDATATTVSCGPVRVAGLPQTCRVRVSDTTTPKRIPTGTVQLSASGQGAFGSRGSACTLAHGTCHVAYTPALASQTITAAFAGSGRYAASSGSGTLTVAP